VVDEIAKNTKTVDEKIMLNVTLIQFLAKMQCIQEVEKNKSIAHVKKIDAQNKASENFKTLEKINDIVPDDFDFNVFNKFFGELK